MPASLENLQQQTLLDQFISVARDPVRVEDFVVECGTEQWTYGDLDSVSTGLALQLYKKHGLQPTVATISENHPYMLAILLATWKLGGIFAPLDCHAPPEMLNAMLQRIKPTCVLVPEQEFLLRDLVQASEIDVVLIPFSDGKRNTITTLAQSFLHESPELSPSSFPRPSPSSIAAYIHTSSASSPSNLKCVPLSHETIFKGSQSRIAWWYRTWPSKSFEKLRVLGWAPWSHIMGVSNDLGAATLGTGGTYVFATVPSHYPSQTRQEESPVPVPRVGKQSDVVDRLLDAIIKVQPEVFAAVPWVLEGLKERYLRLVQQGSAEETLRVQVALAGIKSFGCGGAGMSAEVAVWAVDLGMNISNDFGMTELGRALFHAKLDASNPTYTGYLIADCLIEDAHLVIIDEDGNEDEHEGELLISSHYIGQGYLNYDSSAFNKATDGRVTFSTGDIYEKTKNGRLLWKGRKEDYIQMISSETLDPRPIEKVLNACPAIAHSCVVGNNFLRKPSDFICAIIEPIMSDTASMTNPSDMAKITRAVAAVNRTLPPPLRIAWSRVTILQKDRIIPYTRKGAVFRKKLEELFGEDITKPASEQEKYLAPAEVDPNAINPVAVQSPPDPPRNPWKKDEVVEMVAKVVADVLGIKLDVLRANSDNSFAELGMDSNMAVQIVTRLNENFLLELPLNTCHTFIDFSMLSRAIWVELGNGEKNILSTGDVKNVSSSHNNRSQEVEEVVIVGQALRLPGDINTPESFWEALVSKRTDVMTHVPTDRWDHSSFYRSPTSQDPPRDSDITFEKAGFVDVAHFDNNFFGISAPEAIFVNPTVRLTLETAFEALEDAFIPISKVKGTNMGIFVAVSGEAGYGQTLFNDKGFEAYGRFFGTGIAASTACGRLSYLLDVHGPSVTLDTACSSGLVALDQAVKYLQSRDGESAIVAAANTCIWPGSFGFLCAQKMTSSNSRCATFTNEADGYVPSEGSVAFILKTKSAALRDNDNILAVIRSTGIVHGGRSQGLVAPNVNAQISLQRMLLAKANLDPSHIDFIETHGTGTSLGDLIEIQGINEVFKQSHPEQPLILGAAKSCIGHTEIAAGLVGVLKAIASLKHSAVPGLTHLTNENINQSLNCSVVPTYIPRDIIYFQRKPQHTPHRGLVLANGFAGTIAGVILDGLPTSQPLLPNGTCSEHEPALFVVSAKTADGLRQYLHDYLIFCRNAHPSQLLSICYTTCIGREHYRHRFATVVSNMEELIYSLEAKLEDFSSTAQIGTARGIAFAFPGQGSQYQGMASGLASHYPGFKDILLLSSKAASKKSGYPITSLLLDSSTSLDVTIDDGQVSQICIYVYQYAVCTWLRTLGVVPSAVLGHSLGEISAAVVGGALNFDLGLELVITRARLLRASANQPGGMAIVATSQQHIHGLIQQLDLTGRLVVAVYNGPQSHVISGELVAIDIFLTKAKSDGIRGTKLKVGQAFHSPLIYPMLPLLKEWIDKNEPFMSVLQIPLYSTTHGAEIPTGSRLKPYHWVQHARDPVRFSDAAAALSTSPIDVVLDIGPQPFIWAVLQNLPLHKIAVATTTRSSGDQNVAFLKVIGLLFEHGVTTNLGNLFSSTSQPRAMKRTIPTYPFQRQRHYPTSLPSRHQPTTVVAHTRESSARSIIFPVDQPLLDLLSHHQIEGRNVAPGALLVDFFARSSPGRAVKFITFNAPLVLESLHDKAVCDMEGDGHFSMQIPNSIQKKVCSGLLLSKIPQTSSRIAIQEKAPCTVTDKQQVYSQFRSVQFGPSFRNIQEIRNYATHADAIVHVESSGNPSVDRIRKLDSCLHMFGAIVQKEVPQIGDMDGSFLPTTLEDYTLHCDGIPDSFICRYRLPLESSRNHHVMSTAFEVMSFSGELLVSCRKYSVAWIPAGVVIQNKKPIATPSHNYQFFQTWIPDPISTDAISLLPEKDERMIFVGPQNSRVFGAFSAFAENISCLQLPDDGLSTWSEGLAEKFEGYPVVLVLDVTSITTILPTSDAFLGCCHNMLLFLQLLVLQKVPIRGFVLVSQQATLEHVDLLLNSSSRLNNTPPGVGSALQGMLRVFRREMALDNLIWALELPLLNQMDDEDLHLLVSREMNARQQGLRKHRIVRYEKRNTGGLVRLVPVIRPMNQPKNSPDLCGVTLIVGLGSIGVALATALYSKGIDRIVFISRRPYDDAEVSEAFNKLQSEMNGIFTYIQTDVCDLDSLRQVLVDIQSRFGSIENIIHTAAVIHDATIQNVDFTSFDRVIRPKVLGAWNLHVVSEELCPSLKTFTLLSSISVSLGNQGQIAYVAGNSYMESMAAYRQGRGLPGVCIQLGAWESKAILNLDMINGFVFPVDNEAGIPMILQSMVTQVPGQIIANLDIKKLATMSFYSEDPLFADILKLFPQSLNDRKQEFTAEDVACEVSNVLRAILELRPSEDLDRKDSLVDCGVDSISFAQIRGKVLTKLNVEIPVIYLSNTFTINDIIIYVTEKCRSV